jgi:hypothetical protein
MITTQLHNVASSSRLAVDLQSDQMQLLAYCNGSSISPGGSKVLADAMIIFEVFRVTCDCADAHRIAVANGVHKKILRDPHRGGAVS